MKIDVFQHVVGTENGAEITEYTPVFRFIDEED